MPALVLYCPPMANACHTHSGVPLLSAFQWEDRPEIRGPNKSGPKEKGLHTGQTGSTDDAEQDRHVGGRLWTGVKRTLLWWMLKAVNFPLLAAVLAKAGHFYKFYSITFNSFAQTNTHKEPDMVYRDKCGQCAEAQMVQPQWRCRAAFDGCEWLISGLAGSDRVTSGGAWQPQAYTRAFPPETRWSRNLQDAQQLLSHPYRSPIYSGYLLPLELDRFLSPASSFDGKAAESNGSFCVSQRATLDTKHAYFHFSSLHPFILSTG